MKFKKSITLLTGIIIVLALIASVVGAFSREGQGKFEFKSLHGETVQVYGKGLYKNESISMASQAIAQDAVTLCLGIPLLIAALYLARKGTVKGRIFLNGILGYFLYTYTSYAFLAMYNSLFLIYVVLMSSSFFAFTLTMMSYDVKNITSCFSSKLPVKFIGGVLIFMAAIIGLMWFKRIVPSFAVGTVPEGLEHYTTLVIQALDLGFVLPTAVLSGVLLIKRNSFGYLLTSVIIVKEAALLIVIVAMIIGQITAGIHVETAQLVMFPMFTLMVIYCMYLVLKNIKEPL